jgi:hypothetical protein
MVADRIRTEVLATELNLGEESCGLSVSVGGVTFYRETSFSELYPPCRPAALRSEAERPQSRGDRHHASPVSPNEHVSVR